jgi:hypothetical protein
MYPKLPNNDGTIPRELIRDTMHIDPKLNCLLLAKKGISNIEPIFFICTHCHIYINNNKMPKFALANGLWIGITPNTATKINNGKRNFNRKMSMLTYII